MSRYTTISLILPDDEDRWADYMVALESNLIAQARAAYLPPIVGDDPKTPRRHRRVRVSVHAYVEQYQAVPISDPHFGDYGSDPDEIDKMVSNVDVTVFRPKIVDITVFRPKIGDFLEFDNTD